MNVSPESFPALFVGSTRNEFRAEPEVVVTLYRFLATAGRLGQPIAIAAEYFNETGDHYQVETRVGVYDATQSATQLGGWLTFNGESRIPTDPAERERIKTRAIDQDRERRAARGDDPAE